MDAIIALENGIILRGVGVGKTQLVTGEIVFNTAMTGYQEVITDPSYCGQIVTFTYPYIGNTGINKEDFESDNIHLRAVIARNFFNYPTHWQSTMSITEFLIKHNIPGVYGIDTRFLTKQIREFGSLKSCIMVGDVDENKAKDAAKSSESMSGLNLSKHVSTAVDYQVEPGDTPWCHVGVVDFGVKKSILKQLVTNGCKLTVFPHDVCIETILSKDLDGVLLSNGPGDPKAVDYGITLAKELVNNNMPVMGICLGFQILALALGAKTTKMKFGHHGVNHPIKSLKTGKILITSQNHSFAVEMDSLPKELQVTYLSLFDQTLQGFKHKSKSVFGLQGHPEAGPGPTDALILFDDFYLGIKKHLAKKNIAKEQELAQHA